jgi:hypothetical protein
LCLLKKIEARAGIASTYDYVAAYPPGRDIAPCLPTKTDELRRDPLEVRKATLASIVAKARPGIRFTRLDDSVAR